MSQKINIPSLEKVQETINYFQTIDWAKFKFKDDVAAYIKELDNFFVANLGIVLLSFRKTNTDKFLKRVFRARPFDLSINNTIISEFAHPPAKLSTLQRANLPFHPVFYSSASPQTCLVELLNFSYKKDGDNWYYLSEWTFRENQPLHVTPFLFNGNYKEEVLNTFGNKTVEQLKEKLDSSNKSEIDAIHLILKEYSRLFEKAETHSISSYISHAHLYSTAELRSDIFIYPSIQMKESAINIAIHPNTVNQKMLLNRIFLINVKEYLMAEQTLSFELNKIIGKNDDNGNLKWSEITQEELKEFCNFFK